MIKRDTKSHNTNLLFKDPIYMIIYSGVVNNVGDWKEKTHSHDFSEIMFVKKGKGIIIINDKKHEVKYGDIIVYNPQDLHLELCYPNEEFKVLFVALKELGESKQRSIIETDNQITSTGVNALRYKNYFTDIVEEMQNKTNNNTDLPIHYAGILVSLVRKIFNRKNIDYSDLASFCEDIKKTIDRDFCIIKRIDDVLMELYVSKYYFSNKFKEMYNVTPLQYLMSLKLKYSEELLKNTDLKISEIAAIIGYDNELYFSRLFKKQNAISATEYRNNAR